MGGSVCEEEEEKGRAIGGMIMGIRREMVEKKARIERVEEGMIMGRVRCGEEKWRGRSICE